MHFSKVAAFLAGFSLALAATVPEKRVFTNNGVTFRGEINGHAFEETGTVEEVWATLKARYPEIELNTTAIAEHKNEKRDKVIPPLCIPVRGHPWLGAFSEWIDDGIKYLIGLETTMSIDGHICSRISCSWSSAIHWCNDNDHSISVPSGYLATFAQDLRKYCTKGCNLDGRRYCRTGGQEFEEEEGYNIIVNMERC